MLLNMILSFFRGTQWTWTDVVFALISYAVLILVMLPVHELAHGFVADKLGDHTARWNGRLSLNPFSHLDLWGTIMLILCGIGYAKPVPVNPNNFRKPRRDMMLTSLAGPVSNLLMAALSVLIFKLFFFGEYQNGTMLGTIGFVVFIYVFAEINIMLAVFNLLPIPPLDGSRIWSVFLPGKWAYTLERYSREISWAFIALVVLGVLDKPLYAMQSFFFELIWNLIKI